MSEGLPQQPAHDGKYCFWVDHKDEFIVGITKDGHDIEFGESYSPDTAAKVFWNAIKHGMPDIQIEAIDAALIYEECASYLMTTYPPDTIGANIVFPFARHFKDKALEIKQREGKR